MLLLTEGVHELVVALLPVCASVGHRVAVGRGLAERPLGMPLAVAAAAVVVAARGAGRVRGAAAASAAAHLLDHVHLGPQLCTRRWQGQTSRPPLKPLFQGLTFCCSYFADVTKLHWTRVSSSFKSSPSVMSQRAPLTNHSQTLLRLIFLA